MEERKEEDSWNIELKYTNLYDYKYIYLPLLPFVDPIILIL